MNTAEKEDSVTLGILKEIDKNQDVTQRHLANHLGVALGLANSYLKRCASKGFIKIQQAPANRYLYYLTPKGFSEKSRLSAKYLSTSFDFYRKASKSFTSIYLECLTKDWQRVLLCGLSELTEIAYIRAQEFDVELVGIWDSEVVVEKHLGLPVWNALDQVTRYDACLITSLEKPGEIFCELQIINEIERVFVPDILGLKTSRE
jgi:DNA-binding MarR family transcriptional regulator